MNRTRVTTSKIALPIAPAFMRNAPPTLPGMPSKNSKPARSNSRALAETALSLAPAPQRSCGRVGLDAGRNSGAHRQITTPANSAVAHQQIGAAAQHQEGDFPPGGKIELPWPIRSRRPARAQTSAHAADAQRRPFGQRFVLAHDGARAAEPSARRKSGLAASWCQTLSGPQVLRFQFWPGHGADCSAAAGQRRILSAISPPPRVGECHAAERLSHGGRFRRVCEQFENFVRQMPGVALSCGKHAGRAALHEGAGR